MLWYFVTTSQWLAFEDTLAAEGLCLGASAAEVRFGPAPVGL